MSKNRITRYHIEYDFDVYGEPPVVMIADQNGTSYLEVYESPTTIDNKWTRDDDAWIPGPLASFLLDCMNSRIGAE